MSRLILFIVAPLFLRQSQLLDVRMAAPYYMNVAFIALDNPKVVIFNASVTRYLLGFFFFNVLGESFSCRFIPFNSLWVRIYT